MSEAAQHVSEGSLAAYLDGQLGADERARIAAHLAECRDCRAELVGARAALDTLPLPARRRRGAWLAAGGLAAAAIAGVLLLSPAVGRRAQQAPVVRAAAAGTSFALEPLTPPAEQPVRVADLVFRWRPAAPDAVYDFSLVDAAGALLWQTRSPVALVRLPPEVGARLDPAQRYYWRADVLLPDLSTGTTGDRPFRIQR